MKTAKIIFYAIIIFLAAIGALSVFGLVTMLFQYLFFFAVLIIGGVIALKLLRSKPDPPRLEPGRAEKELNDAVRRMEEIKRKLYSKQ